MKLQDCAACRYGSEKGGSSFCEFEACYGFLTKCIQKRALQAFFEGNRVGSERAHGIRSGEERRLESVTAGR